MSNIFQDRPEIHPTPHNPILTKGPVDNVEDEKVVMTEAGTQIEVLEVKVAEEAMLAENEFTEDDYRKLRRKIDFILLPLMWWCYGIQQSDKTGLSTMNLYGLQASTGMVGNQYSLLTVMFYVAYAMFEFPSNIILQRYNMGKCLTVYMFTWGIIVLVQAFLTDWAQFMVFRFLQGAFECTISPGFNLIIASWYTAREHSSRALVFQSANAGWGVVVSLVMYGIAVTGQQNPSGWAYWRGIPVFLGGQTLIAAGVAWFMLGTPNEVRWLTKREKVMANARIMKNNTGTDLTGKKTWKWNQVKESFQDPVLYFQFIVAFLSSVVNGSLTTFGSVVVASFGFTQIQVILYGIPQSVVSVLYFVVVGYSSLKIRGIRMWWMIFSTLPPFCGLLGVALLPSTEENKWPKWGCYFITVTFVIPLFSSWALIASNTAGRTKRSIISSTSFIGYCTGNIAGSQVMQAKDAPRYIPGTITMAVCMAVQTLVILSWRYWLVYQNKKKAREAQEAGLSPDEIERRGQMLGAEDVTDLKNPYFVYEY